MFLNLPRYPRYLTAAAGSAFMTVGIVYLMVQLVSIDDVQLTERPPLEFTDWLRVPEEVTEPPVKVLPKPPLEVEPPPPQPPMDRVFEGGNGVDVAFNPPVAGGPGEFKSPTLLDGEHIPIVKVAPVYPNRAVQRGIEGYVVLSFTITPTGATADAVVIESNPSGVFDRSALGAVRKFKYKPKVVDGEAKPVYNVQHKLTFELANG